MLRGVISTPLPDLLRSRIMDPIGASDSWEWHGYSTSYVDLDGTQVQSVSGGGHWGGGLFISTRDHARFGLLHQFGGEWGGEQLLPEGWLEIATEPSPTNNQYGCATAEPRPLLVCIVDGIFCLEVYVVAQCRRRARPDV